MQLRAVLRPTESDTATFANEAAKSFDRRGSKRRSLALAAHTSSRTMGELPVHILDISQGGLLLETNSAELWVDDQVEVELPECGIVTARVAWKSGSFVGCQFRQLVSPAAISAALLKADPLAREVSHTQGRQAAAGAGIRIEPELNFSIAALMAITLWGLISLALYTTLP